MFKLSTTSCMASVWFCDSHQHRWYSPSRICPPSGRRSQLMEIRKLPLPAGAELWQNTFDWPDLAASTRACQFHSVSILLQSASAMDFTEFPYLNPNRSNGSLNGSSIFRAESSIPKSSQTQPNPISWIGSCSCWTLSLSCDCCVPTGVCDDALRGWRSLPSQFENHRVFDDSDRPYHTVRIQYPRTICFMKVLRCYAYIIVIYNTHTHIYIYII